jgi:hypothetical protein
MICIMESHTRCATNRSQPHQSLIKKTEPQIHKGDKNVKLAILAKVISVKKRSPCSVAVRGAQGGSRDCFDRIGWRTNSYQKPGRRLGSNLQG